MFPVLSNINTLFTDGTLDTYRVTYPVSLSQDTTETAWNIFKYNSDVNLTNSDIFLRKHRNVHIILFANEQSYTYQSLVLQFAREHERLHT